MSAVSELREKRARLVARAAAERAQLAVQLQAWRAPLSLLDRAVAGARYLRRHPQWIVAAAVILAILRPRRAFIWARRGFLVWRTWRWLFLATRKLGARKPA